jgi:hypothetical protein
MVSAHKVLNEVVHELRIVLLSPSLGTPDDLRSLLNLARAAVDAADGHLPNEQVLAAPLHWTTLARLGLEETPGHVVADKVGEASKVAEAQQLRPA